MSCNCELELNPDITGIGVRAALYVQILLGWTISCIWPDTFAKNARTAYMTAIALLIAAFIQLRTQTLSLLDGIVVSLVTSMMITFAISSSPTRSNAQKQATEAEAESEEVDPNKSKSRFFTQFVFVAFWVSWCLYLWHDPANFGSDERDCVTNPNLSVMIIIFGREISAIDSRMKAAALALVSIGAVTALGSLFISLEDLLGPILDRYRNKDATIGQRAGGIDEPDEDLILRIIRRFLQAMSFATLIYLIVATELTIKKNDPEKSTRQWSYGQTIALILLLQQFMDVCSTYIEKKGERKEREEREEKLDVANGAIELNQRNPAA